MITSESKGVYLSKFVIIGGIFGGLGIILLVGLLCGLVARPNNCIKDTTTQLTTLSTSTTSTTSTSTTFSTTSTPAPTSSTSTSTSTLRPTSTSSTTRTTTSTSTSSTTRTTTSTSTPSTTRTTASTPIQTTITRTLPPLTTLSTNPGLTSPPIGDGIRLPDYIIPKNYNMVIKAFFNPISTGEADNNNRFEGTETIDIQLTRASNRIVFHCDNSIQILDTIQITSVSNNQVINVKTNQHRYMENQLYEILLDQNLPIGNYKLKLDYEGNFGPNTNIIGFYKTSYQEDGVTKNLVATKFQPTDARKAYPCFDEPALKATYEITIEHPSGTIALSNWPQTTSSSISGNRIRTNFEKTYAMSSYLAAWTILPQDFGQETGQTQKGKPIRIFGRKAAQQKGLLKFARDVAKQSLDYFENEYFDSSLRAVPPKIDLIGFPDFPSGAMEHWGLIGFRETSLFYSEQENSISSKQGVAHVVAHEIAHFWFGNLVTCKWWNDLWLNEAMARFLQFKAVDKLFPDWDVNNQFLTSYQIPVMFEDGYQTSHPVSLEVLTPAQINSVFDTITYDKGSSLLRMLESTVGAQNFREGLNSFLKKNEFSTAVAAEFYNTLKLPNEMSSVTPQQYMENWLLQKNYPEVAVILESSSSKTRVRFRQQRFLLSPEEIPGIPDESPFGFKWMIYLQCRAGGVYDQSQGPLHLSGQIKEFSFFLDEFEGIYDGLDRRYTWVKCNNEFRGFYVTDYAPAIFDAFTNILSSKIETFNVADRANLLHTAFSLAYLGSQSYAVPALLTSYLSNNELDYIPWRVFTWHLNRVARILEHRPSFIELKDFSTYIIRNLVERLNIWDDSGSHQQRLLKTSVIDFLCRMQDARCLTNATRVFERINQDYFTNPNGANNDVAPNLRGLVYEYHIENTYDYNDVFKLFDVYPVSVDPQEKSLILNAVSQSRLAWILDIYLAELFKPDSQIRPQDFFSLLIYISRNPSGRHIAWYTLRHYWYDIVRKFGLSSRTLANSVKSICDSFENPYLLIEMEEFFLTTSPGAGAYQRIQALDIVLHNIFWVIDREEDMKENLFIPFIKKFQKY